MDANTKKDVPKHSEPRLPRKALLATLQDRQTVTSVIQRRPYTCISVMSWFNGSEYTGVGFSKVCFPDGWDVELGCDIANRRALIDILHQVRWDEATAAIRAEQESGYELLEDIPF